MNEKVNETATGTASENNQPAKVEEMSAGNETTTEETTEESTEENAGEGKVVSMNASTEEESTEETPAEVPKGESKGEIMDRQVKNKAITFDTAHTLGGMLNDYMGACVDMETREWSKCVGIMKRIEEVMRAAEKDRETVILKYVCKDEKGQPIIESYEAPLAPDAPEGAKPEIKQRYAYANDDRQKCTDELNVMVKEKTYFFNIQKMSRSGFLKTHINPQQFKALDAITRFFVGN